MKTRWRKHDDCPLPYWTIKIGPYEGYVLDDTAAGNGFVGSITIDGRNSIRVTKKFQHTARKAKVIVLLIIRRECREMLDAIDHMDTKYR